MSNAADQVKSNSIWKKLTTTLTYVEGTGNLEKSSFVDVMDTKARLKKV